MLIDGEAVAHCENGLPDFHRTLSAAGQREACLLAFDLLAVDGEDLRPLPLLARRKRLEGLLASAPQGLLFSEHMDGPDGEAMFRHACRLGLEGIVAKRKGSRYALGPFQGVAENQKPGVSASGRAGGLVAEALKRR